MCISQCKFEIEVDYSSKGTVHLHLKISGLIRVCSQIIAERGQPHIK